MKKQEYEITIDASPKKVWNVLLGTDTYPQWTSPFSPSSQVTTDWQQGSKAIFHDGSGQGMVSEIVINRPYEYLSIRHLSSLKEGEQHDDNTIDSWAGAMENYTLQQTGGKTKLLIELDVTDEFVEEMNTMWPKALNKVKELSEASHSDT